MVSASRSVFLLALLVAGASALDISRLLGLSGDEEAKETPSETGEQRQLLAQLGQIGAALNPLNVVNAAFSALPTLPAVPRRTVTKTLFIQVTSTQTQYPMCVTAYGVMPPCAALSPEPEQQEQLHYNPHDAYHTGNAHGELAHDIAHQPHLGMVGHVPRPGGHYDVYGYHDDEHEYGYRDAGVAEIQPTTAVRMLESTAMLELPREKREVSASDVELDGSVVAEPERESQHVRPHPRYLAGLGEPGVDTITKTLYMTKVEKHVNHHVTATMVAHNCIPDHMPFCPRSGNTHYAPQPAAPVHPVAAHNGQQQHQLVNHHQVPHPVRPQHGSNGYNNGHNAAHNNAGNNAVHNAAHNNGYNNAGHNGNNAAHNNGHLHYRGPEEQLAAAPEAEKAEVAAP